MHVVENTIDIARPVEAVFDYCADMRTEALWNPAVKSVRLASVEPVGPGSRYVGEFSGFGRATMEVAEYHRPGTWTTRTTAAKLPFRLVGTVVEGPTSGSSRLTMRIELLPTGVMTLLAPLMAAMMRPTARANMTRIKAAVEQ